MDKYQERYLEHVRYKLSRNPKKTIYGSKTRHSVYRIMKNRKSVRHFNDNEISKADLEMIELSVDLAPSSCNRKGIYLKECSPQYAEDILVGGTGWAKNANKVFLMFGAKLCYKNPKEIPYMPYLDAGFVAENIYLACEAIGLGCCFINPNLKDPVEFLATHGEDYFCGAIALGEYDG